MTTEAEVVAFVKESTAHFDESHSFEHAWRVYQSSLAVLATLLSDYDHELIMFASLLHDVCDHKYP